ncbi:MAG: sugar-phospahte nucleotidyltransferase [Lachnospiraceae bacterium]|nr:sugar-phospahte nucleotidyltransferase [Lachnospiraceae bacterium]
MAQIQHSFSTNDEYYTPAYAVIPILKYLKSGTTIWCPFDTEESQYVKIFSANGFHVIHGHIQTGQDFFTVPVPDCDYIISNPPYSLKGKVIKRLYEIGKPFAMLINFQGIFDSKERFKMFRENRVEMLWLSPRISYKRGDGKPENRAPFQSGYLCSGICERQLEFEYLFEKI